jgi:5-methylcytosine-specific restriction endonuclease McrA
MQIDHIVPVSKGGTDDESNLQSLCFLCNGRKSNRLTTEEVRRKYHPATC